MRTYSRDEFERSRREWADFGHEWAEVKRLAQGFTIFPPSGTRHDDRDAENPSQRAVVYRAMVDQPTELRRILGRARSWFQVVDQIIGVEARLRADADDAERDIVFDRAARPDHRQAVMSLAQILGRIEESR